MYTVGCNNGITTIGKLGLGNKEQMLVYIPL
jgi:hypothetical protein